MVDPTGVGILASQANTLTLSGLNPSHLICMICTNKSNILTSDCHTLFLSLPLNANCCSCMVSPMQNVIRLRLLPAALQETFLFTLDIQLLIARFFLLFCMIYCLYMKKWSHYCTIGFSISGLNCWKIGVCTCLARSLEAVCSAQLACSACSLHCVGGHSSSLQEISAMQRLLASVG